MNFRIATLLLLFASCCSVTRGDFTYSLRFDNTNLTLAPAQVATLGVFLDENISGSDAHRIGDTAGNNGLLNANFRVARSGPGMSVITFAAANPGFDATTPAVTPTASLEQAVVVNSPVVGTGTPSRSVQLGTFTFTGGAEGDVNVFSLADFSAGDDFTIGDGFNPSFVADGVINFGSTTISVTAIPEPSSITLFGLAGGLAATCGAFRNRRANQKQST